MRPVLVASREVFIVNKTTDKPHDELSRDASVVIPQRVQKPALNAPAIAPAVNRQPDLEGRALRDVLNDTTSRAFCGPTAVAAITGAPVSLVRDAYRLVRNGPSWTDMPRAPAITSTRFHETEKVLRLLGFAGSWQPVAGSPTLAAFLEARSGIVRTHPCAVFVTGHVVAVSGWQFCDTFTKGIVVEADDAPRRRSRVKRVLVITTRIPPSTIPRKDHSAAKARAAAGQKMRGAYTRFLAGMGARHEIDREHPAHPTITVTFSDGKRIGMHFDDWEQALGDLKYVLEEPEDEEIEEIEEGFYWYGF